MDSKDIVYVTYLPLVDEYDWVERSIAHTIHRKKESAERELNSELSELLKEYKDKILCDTDSQETQEIIKESCYIREVELID